MRVLVTGGAGFIGRHVCAALVGHGAEVVVLDDLSTGRHRPSGCAFIEGDIRDAATVVRAMEGCTHVAHLAALASVPRSVAQPELSEAVNLRGTLNILEAAKAEGVSRFVFSSTSAVYGDATEMPVTEATLTRCLSPYAEDKLAAEVAVLHSGLEAVSLRYFNVHGPGQDPNGAYAAVIPKFIDTLLAGERPRIFGDGGATRDFVRVQDVAALNLAALTTTDSAALGEAYNVASGRSISVLTLFETLRDLMAERDPAVAAVEPIFEPPREGDVLHSAACIAKARKRLGFNPQTDPRQALRATVEAYSAVRE